MTDLISAQLRRSMGALGAFADWAMDPELFEGLARPSVCDFVFGNPHDLASDEYVDAIVRAAKPTGPRHYAYTQNDPAATEAIASGLRDRFAMPFEADDVYLTNGNFTGLSLLLRALTDPGDEVVFVSPPWFFYESLIVGAQCTPVRVFADRTTFDLDLDAIAAALTPKTRAIIVNSPNNPSGRIYPPSTVEGLARILTDASGRNGRPIWMLSDEAYNRIVFDDRAFQTPTAAYPHSFLVYTYAKTQLAPGSRLGYVAVPPTMPEREELRSPLLVAQITTGWGFPISVLQFAIPDLEKIAYDLSALQRRRDVLVTSLREQGYDLLDPEGTFYILVRSPLEDDVAFCKLLNAQDVYVLPGAMFESPGWFRISITASDDMVERGIPGFARAIEEARG
ncbi:MAG TPA: aminotransferase class I/II-fold pyridoxal phosphate-dependent enzyme [Actinomycetota bacterium]|jgi:aspartate aminotransferase